MTTYDDDLKKDVYSEIDPSIYNNAYYIPQIIRCQSLKDTLVTINTHTSISSLNADRVQLKVNEAYKASYIEAIITDTEINTIYRIKHFNKNSGPTPRYVYCLYMGDTTTPSATYDATDEGIEIYLPNKNCLISAASGV